MQKSLVEIGGFGNKSMANMITLFDYEIYKRCQGPKAPDSGQIF